MKEAIILLNMGGPNNLDEVELFLKNMFNDPNILTMKSSLLRRFVAGMITFMRTESSQEIYRKLGGKSPIVDHTKRVVSALQESVGDDVTVDFVMRYTPPFADEVVERLVRENVKKVYLIPLYPQYSTTTTKSSLEDFEEAAYRSGLDAVLYEIKHYYENELYNEALISRIEEKMDGAECRDYDLIFSAHGLPQKIVDAGDPYRRQIERHVEILKKKLLEHSMPFRGVHLAYQSKVGPMKWLEPSLDETLETMKGRKAVVYPLAFTIDNSETDFELEIEYREFAQEYGLEDYRVCDCVNDHPLFIEALADIYRKMR